MERVLDRARYELPITLLKPMPNTEHDLRLVLSAGGSPAVEGGDRLPTGRIGARRVLVNRLCVKVGALR